MGLVEKEKQSGACICITLEGTNADLAYGIHLCSRSSCPIPEIPEMPSMGMSILSWVPDVYEYVLLPDPSGEILKPCGMSKIAQHAFETCGINVEVS